MSKRSIPAIALALAFGHASGAGAQAVRPAGVGDAPPMVGLPQVLPPANPEIGVPDAVLQHLRLCSGRSDRAVRLECYDQLGAYLSSRVGARATQEYAWAIQTGVDREGRPQATIAIEATAAGSTIDAAGTDLGKISLVIRCRAGAGAAYVSFDRRVVEGDSPRALVMIHLGMSLPQPVSWEVSQSGESVGVWRDQTQLRSLLSAMLGAPTIRVGVGSGGANEMSATFSLAGYPTAYGAVREACQW